MDPLTENPLTQLAEDWAQYLMDAYLTWEELTKDMPPFGFAKATRKEVQTGTITDQPPPVMGG